MSKEYNIQTEETALPIKEIGAKFARGMEMMLPKQQIINYLKCKKNYEKNNPKSKII